MKNKWKEKRRKALEKAEANREEIRRMREEEEVEKIVREMLERIRRKEEDERRKKIEEFKYNTKYKDVMTEEMPRYLQGRKKKKDRITIARYRCGNEWRGGQHWREEEEKMCRVCGEKEESMVHVLKECEATKDEMTPEEILNEDGRGWEVLKRIYKIREEKEKDAKEKRNRPV